MIEQLNGIFFLKTRMGHWFNLESEIEAVPVESSMHHLLSHGFCPSCYMEINLKLQSVGKVG